MGKRTSIILVIILLAGLAVLGYFLQQGRKTFLTDPYKAIPQSAAVLIETVDLQSFINLITTGKGLTGEVLGVKEFSRVSENLKYLAEQLNKPWFKKIEGNGPAIISFHSMAGSNLKALLSMAVPADVRTGNLKSILHQAGIKNILQTKFQGNVLLAAPFRLENRNDTAYFSLVSGLLVCSTSRKLIYNSILQTENKNDIRSLPGFSHILQASGRKEDKVFIVFRNLRDLLTPLFRQDKTEYAVAISRLAECAGGDIYLGENGLVISGYSESTDPGEGLFKFRDGMPGTFHTYKILPSSTSLFESINRNAVKVSYKPADSGAGKFAEKIREFAGDEVTRVIVDIKGHTSSENTLVIYELKNRAYVEKLLLDKIKPEINKDNISFFAPDEQVKIPIYHTPFKGFASAMLPGFTKDYDDSLFAFYDNYLIAGNSIPTISRLLYDNLLNKTLANDLAYRDFETTLPSIAGYYFYCVPSLITNYLARFLTDDIIKGLAENESSLGRIGAIGYKNVSSNNMIYNSLSVRFSEGTRMESTTEWETLLDTIAAIKPFFFTNHITGAREIFIQDMNNYAYLINAAGRILWKVPVNERITGNVFMIDYFRNGKYQLLFSGVNYLHLLDRNGNYVERYPVKLRSRATNSLSLFDYDNNGDYRILIAGEDKMIYSYDKSGNVVKGWKSFRTNGTVRSEISWFRVSGKDYLVAADETSVYFLDRTGNIRLNMKEPVTKASNSYLRLVQGSTPYVVCSAPDGTVQQMFFDGNVNKFSLGKFSAGHSFDIFDVNGDGFGEYIFIDRGILYLYDHNRAEIFNRQFSSDEVGGPINFIFSSSDRKIGVIEIKKNLIYLIDADGNTMNGFPLRGASMFSIGKLSGDSGWHLIVGGTDRFLYNYRLDTGVK